MKRFLLLVLLAVLTASCTKKDEQPAGATLNVTTYLKDYNGTANSVKASYFLLGPEDIDVLQSADKLMEKGTQESNSDFYEFDAYNKKVAVLPGEYYLAVQLNITRTPVERGRYAYKKITLKAGDELNTIMVFQFAGKAYTQEPWSESK